jgi:hypothetical protein
VVVLAGAEWADDDAAEREADQRDPHDRSQRAAGNPESLEGDRDETARRELRSAHAVREPARGRAPLSVPSVFQWYTPLWAAVDAMLAGRYNDVERVSASAEQAGLRAGDRNAELFAGMVRFCAQLEREAFDEIDAEFAERGARRRRGDRTRIVE